MDVIENALEFVKKQGWKYRISGDEIEVGCPMKDCPNHGEPQFYINQKTNKWNCHRCGNKGKNLKELEFKAGLLKLMEAQQSSHIFIPNIEVLKYQTALTQNKVAMDYLTQQRSFTLETIQNFRLGVTKINNEDVIVIPFFDSKNNCVALKYNHFTKNVKPKYTFKKDSKIQFFNLDCAVKNQKNTLIITEGEFDAMSLWQYGYENVGSIPNGAQGMTEWIEEIQQFPDYVLLMDNDPAGNDAANSLGKILGLTRCRRAYPKLKDINECLQAGLPDEDIEDIFNKAEPMFVAPVFELSKFAEEAGNNIENEKEFNGVSTGWKSFDYHIGGIRGGEVTVVSGRTGDGKTTFSTALIAEITEQDQKSLIISPEMREADILVGLSNNYWGKQVKTSAEINEALKRYNGKVYIANVFNQWTAKSSQSVLDRVFDIVEFSIKYYGVKFIFLDHLRLFLNPKEQESERFCIDQFMQKCVRIAIANNVHIWLIVQPKNLPANQKKVTLMDLKGSSNVAQDAHNIVLIHRVAKKGGEGLVEIDVPKVRSRVGNCGTFVLKFDTDSKSNYIELESE